MRYYPGLEDQNPGRASYSFTMVFFDALRGNELYKVLLSTSRAAAEKAGDLAPVVLFITYLRHLMVAYTELWDGLQVRVEKEISIHDGESIFACE